MSIPFFNLAHLTIEEEVALRHLIDTHHGVDDVFAWGRAQDPPVHPADVVKQDEFTHDVLVPFPSGRWLVYGTT